MTEYEFTLMIEGDLADQADCGRALLMRVVMTQRLGSAMVAGYGRIPSRGSDVRRRCTQR